MSRKKRTRFREAVGTKQNKTIKERILEQPLFIALIGSVLTVAFVWAYATIGLFSFLLFIVNVIGVMAIGVVMIYIFFKIIEGMRNGESYTTFAVDTPFKRFLEYAFITIFTLGLGIFFQIIAIKNAINVWNAIV